MAIQQPVVPITYTLQNEVASRVILLTRDVVDNVNGSVSTNFGCTIHPKSITYEVDTNQNKIGIYDFLDLAAINVTQDQLMSLFGMRVTPADGTVSYVGELLSNFADQIISAQVPDLGNITTQHIDIQAVLTAQAAQDLAAQQAAIAAQDAANQAANAAAQAAANQTPAS